MSFDINEAMFDSEGSYLEEPALRYEQALMEQFAASPEGHALLGLCPACLPATASQAAAGPLEAAGSPTPGACLAGARQLWHGQVLCPDGTGGGL